MRRAGFAVGADRVLVTSGSQHGMTAVFASLFAPGDVVATESLTYPGMKTLAGLLALRLQGVAMDEHGLRPDAFAAACRARRPKALYCVPTLQNPTTAVMPVERRQEIAAIAREHGVLIVEDDVHGRLLARPRAAAGHLRARHLRLRHRHGQGAWPPACASASSWPRPRSRPRIAAGIRGTTWMAAPLMAEIAARWIQDGTAETHPRPQAQGRGGTLPRGREGARWRFAVAGAPGRVPPVARRPAPVARGRATRRRRAARAWPSRPRRPSRWGGAPIRKRSASAWARRADKEVLARALGILAGLLTTTPEAPESFGP